MDKEAVEHMHETMQSSGRLADRVNSGRLADRVNCPHMEKERRCATQDTGKFRGITLLSHIMKLLERILDNRLRESVEQELGEEQLGFRKGRGTIDGMFSLRQLVEKRLER